MIYRDSKFYTAGYAGDNADNAPLFVRCEAFDSDNGDFTAKLIKDFNEYLKFNGSLSEYKITDYPEDIPVMPKKLIIVNASHDNLPTSYETARVFKEFFKEKALEMPVEVVNTYAELMQHIDECPDEILLLSQCVDKNVYNIEIAEGLEKKGVVLVPGKITAPGSIFSDKDSTYKLLSDNGTHWDMVARYKKVEEEGKSIEEVVNGIFKAIDILEKETKDNVFFVKPHEGGGGLGGFRVAKHEKGYIIPDLSKVSGDSSNVKPTYIDIDISDRSKLSELLWIYRLFYGDEQMKKNYLHIDLPLINRKDEECLKVLEDYLSDCKYKREEKIASMVISEEKAREELVKAITIFEEKFQRQYVPLVNEHIDFGMWGLRAHYRLSENGPVLETMYSRIFQLAFTEEGIGYLGSDNISNKQTGQLEILRLGPINSIMVDSIGGKQALFDTLYKGAEALAMITDLLACEERSKVPVRVQLDLAAVSKRIGEGNADTARGLCLASKWENFRKNNREWLADSLRYYSWKKRCKS